jgi:ribonuclease P protein component
MLTFTRPERLKSRKTIGSLFKGGHSYVAYPLRVVWKEASPYLAAMSRAQIMVSVSKRTFKTAVARNRIKRQIREAYRLHKQEFYDKLSDSDLHISFMVSYIAKEPLPFSDISAGVSKLIRKFPGDQKKQAS